MPAVLAPSPITGAHRFYGAGILGVRVDDANPRTCVLAIPVLSRPDLQSGGLERTFASPAVVWREVPPERIFMGLVDSTPPPPGLDVGRDPTVSLINSALLIGSEACAWNALDWLVVSRDAAAVLGDDWLGDLIATGTGVCIRGDPPPPGPLPWRPIAGGWVLIAPSPGARIGPWVPDAYLPAQTWQPHQPPAFRRQVVAVAVGVAGMALAGALLKGRRRTVATVAAAIATTAGIALWSLGTSTATMVQSRVLVVDDVVRADHWVFVSGLSGGRVRVPWRNGLIPVFASREQPASLLPQLIYHAGQPVAYECVLQPGQTLALRWQALLPSVPGSDVQPLTASPMRAVAEAFYMPPGWSLRGQLIPADDDQWPPLVSAPVFAGVTSQ